MKEAVAGLLMQKILLNNKTYMKIAKKGLARKIRRKIVSPGMKFHDPAESRKS